MTIHWDKDKIGVFIDDEVEESLTLDYKAAEALGKSDGKKREITKDVSAMANSSGGIIIYGVKEYNQDDKRHLPELITPIDRRDFSKEWIEHVMNNIRPKINGLHIFPVSLDSGPNDVIYIVEIPQRDTAHQALDKRYYKRFNFESVPMDDYEIRDVMGREKHAKLDLEFEIEFKTKKTRNIHNNTMEETTTCTLKIYAKNTGRVYAHYVSAFIRLPMEILHNLTLEQIKYQKEEFLEEGGKKYREYIESNTVRDVVDVDLNLYSGGREKYGPSRYDPILPDLSHIWEFIIKDDYCDIQFEDIFIKWEVYADNSPVRSGEISTAEILISDKRKVE